VFRERVSKGGTKLISDKVYAYDEFGVVVRSGLDVNASGTLTNGSTDRFTEGETKFKKSGECSCLLSKLMTIKYGLCFGSTENEG
jgi:hypothetical protein